MREVYSETLEQVSKIDTNINHAFITFSNTLELNEEDFHQFTSIKGIVKMLIGFENCSKVTLGLWTITCKNESKLVRITQMSLKHSENGNFDLLQLIIRPIQ